MHFTRHNPAAQAHKTRCVEQQIFFHADECKKELPKGGRLTEKHWHTRSWFECQETSADSWIAGGARGSRMYKAEAFASDENALTALLAPLSPQARATLQPADLKHPFQRTFQGPGLWSFFVVGTGSAVTAYAVANLDDFQFADLATDFSSSSATIKTEALDFATMAEDAGVKLSYHAEMSHRAMPPPGGMEAAPSR
ncbi:MAG: hypothetical protein ACREUL_05695 [Steroidobacteraceae bacterium]